VADTLKDLNMETQPLHKDWLYSSLTLFPIQKDMDSEQAGPQDFELQNTHHSWGLALQSKRLHKALHHKLHMK
jgi:hypothetical protein